jgi:CO/xanthine dehydrogenase FAD-binding subunit
VKPAAFRYHAPERVDVAVRLLSEHGEDAKVLAGGPSLGPLLNLRLATPAVLVDVNRIPELDGHRVDPDGSLHLGAMTRQRDVECSAAVARGWPLLAQALPFVAHRTIRNRGTIGGSLAHADPAAELPAVAVALDAEITAAGVDGERTVPAASFFDTYFTTSLAADELLTAVRLPPAPARSGYSWQEFAPRHGDFAIVGVAACVTLSRDGAVEAARLVYSGVADAPLRVPAAEAVLVGQPPTDSAVTSAADAAAAAVQPPADLIASTRYRRRLVQVLTRRAVTEAAARAQEG